MKGLRLAGFTLVIFLALGVASVYANSSEGSVGLPILGTSGAPALAAPSLFSGVFSVLYADGTPVVLESNRVTFDLCNDSNCGTVTAVLQQTAPGIYAYSFTPPSLTGIVTIYVKAYALADDNGRIFPQIDTSIGTYYFAPSTSTATSSSVPPATNPPPAPPAPVGPPLTSQAVNSQTNQATLTRTGSSPIQPLLIVLSLLAVAGSLLTVWKRQ